MTRKLGPSPPPSSPATHNVMLSNRGKDTNLELMLRKALRLMDVRAYRVNYKIGRTHADIAFPGRKVAILVHGCFWHHCPDCNLPLPKTHRSYWARKFELNRARDERVRNDLREKGWRVVEIWEHEAKKDVTKCAKRIQTTVTRNP